MSVSGTQSSINVHSIVHSHFRFVLFVLVQWYRSWGSLGPSIRCTRSHIRSVSMIHLSRQSFCSGFRCRHGQVWQDPGQLWPTGLAPGPVSRRCVISPVFGSGGSFGDRSWQWAATSSVERRSAAGRYADDTARVAVVGHLSVTWHRVHTPRYTSTRRQRRHRCSTRGRRLLRTRSVTWIWAAAQSLPATPQMTPRGRWTTPHGIRNMWS